MQKYSVNIVVLLFILFCLPLSAQWVQLTGPDGGQVKSSLVASSGMFVGLERGGIYRSVDNGATWTKSSGIPVNCDVTALYEVGTVLFAGTSFTKGVPYGVGIYKSTDNGQTWQLSSSGLPATAGVMAFAAIGNTLFAGVQDYYNLAVCLYKSTNAGATWSATGTGLSPVTGVTHLAVSGNNLLAVAGSLYRSSDNGNTFTQAVALSVVPALYTVGNTVYLGGADGFRKSTDNGITWSTPTTTLTNFVSIASLGNVLFAATSDFSFTTGGTFTSTDDGATWTKLTNGLPQNYKAYRLWTKGTDLFMGMGGNVRSYGAVYKSADNGNSWVQTSSGIKAATIINLQSFTGKVYAIGDSYNTGVSFTTNQGTTWVKVSTVGITNTPGSVVQRNDTLFAMDELNGISRSVNGGTSWTKLNGSPRGKFYVAGNTIYVYGSNGIYSSVNGNSWQQLNTAGIFTVDKFAVRNNSLFIMTLQSIYKSTDGGATWRTVNTGLDTTQNFSAIYAHPNVMLVSGTRGVYRSLDDGNTWQRTDTTVYAETFGSAGSVLFAAHKFGNVNYFTYGGGFLLSTDNGLTWYKSNAGLPDGVFINTITADNNYVYAGTDGNYIYRREISQLTGLKESGGTANITGFELQQNYPNPFNPATKITFEVPVTSSVKLLVYNSTGELVRILENGIFEPGTYSSNFDAKDLPSGLYLYVLQANGMQITRKMLLMK